MFRPILRYSTRFKHFRYSSSSSQDILKPAVTTGDSDRGKRELKEYERISKITVKTRTKKPQRPPFAKNLFLGEFDVEMLTYPQLAKQDYENLEKSLPPICDVVQGCEAKTMRDFIKTLGDNKLIGLQASQLLGGRELNETESCRLAQVISEHKFNTHMISNEYLGVRTIQKFGNEKQRQAYFNKLLTGNLITAFCVSDNVESGKASVTTAERSENDRSYRINGEKMWVLNGCSGDLLIVLAETNRQTIENIEEIEISAFLVDGTTKGVIRSKCEFISSDLEMSNIKFDNVIVPEENMLGLPGEGRSVVENVLPSFRLGCSTLCIDTTKQLLKKFLDHCLSISTKEVPIYETEAVSIVTGKIVSSIYAMESMTYFVSGLLDQYENQDCDLECALIKAFNARHTFAATSACIDFLGTTALLEGHWCYKFHTDALNYLVLQEPVDSLELSIALTGLKHVGNKTGDVVKKMRNPLYYSSFVFKKMFMHRRDFTDDPKLNLGLESYVHPSLLTTTKALEYCVLRLKFGTEVLLSRHGLEVVNKHAHLKRLAECAMDVLAMTACIGRASRAYCIGLQYADYEMLIANAFCVHTKQKVQERIQGIVQEERCMNDDNFKTISDNVFKLKNYFPVHPLTRNY